MLHGRIAAVTFAVDERRPSFERCIGDQFAVAEANFDRKSSADFFLLREARRARYQGSRAVPILDVIDAVELPDVVKHTIKQILTPAIARE